MQPTNFSKKQVEFITVVAIFWTILINLKVKFQSNIKEQIVTSIVKIKVNENFIEWSGWFLANLFPLQNMQNPT